MQINTTDEGKKTFNFFFIYINTVHIYYMHPVYQSRRVICSIHMKTEFYCYMIKVSLHPQQKTSVIQSHFIPQSQTSPNRRLQSLPLPEASSCVIPVILLTLPRREVTKATLLSTKYNLRDCELHESNYVRNSDMTIMKSRGLQNRGQRLC